jgi:hypothetical protein
LVPKMRHLVKQGELSLRRGVSGNGPGRGGPIYCSGLAPLPAVSSGGLELCGSIPITERA